jgi:replication factor A2
MEIKQWIDEDDTEATAQQREAFVEGAFVKVVGQVRSFGGKSTITAYNVKAVTDHNEVTTHFLDAVYVHLFNTRGPIAGSKVAAGGLDAGAGAGGGTFDAGTGAATFNSGGGGYGDTGAGAGGGSDFTSTQV